MLPSFSVSVDVTEFQITEANYNLGIRAGRSGDRIPVEERFSAAV
jgi:hypothetical protein